MKSEPNKSLQPTHPAPRHIMPVASKSTFIVVRKTLFKYHVLCSGLEATGTPLLGSGCAAELRRSPSNKGNNV